jgi:hypothetical protein
MVIYIVSTHQPDAIFARRDMPQNAGCLTVLPRPSILYKFNRSKITLYHQIHRKITL